MRAIVQNAYGSSEVVRLAEIATPAIGPKDVLVRVAAASLHAGDVFLMRGRPYPARFATGWPAPKDRVVGLSVAGVVHAVGPEVRSLRVGDEVFGECRGSCAEYAPGTERTLVRKPATLSWEQAAALPTSALAALQCLRDAAHVEPGQRVLINGASGGVGHFAVQIAAATGAHVTGVCGPANVEMVKSLGADEVIDYTQGDFTTSPVPYDVILDNVGNRSFAEMRRVLAPSGVVVPNSGTVGLGSMLGSTVRSLFTRQQGRMYLSMPNPEDLRTIAQMAEQGSLRAVIDRVAPLERVPDELEHLAGGHSRGKTVIIVAEAGV